MNVIIPVDFPLYYGPTPLFSLWAIHHKKIRGPVTSL